MKWKFVYNPKVIDGYENGDIECRALAVKAGYKFYMWNGMVRFTSDGHSTGITEDEMI